MRVNKNAPTIEYGIEENSFGIACGPYSNIPIRLEIAVKIMAGIAANPNFKGEFTGYDSYLKFADEIIEAHNKEFEP